jgi:hypothetical protein
VANHSANGLSIILKSRTIFPFNSGGDNLGNFKAQVVANTSTKEAAMAQDQATNERLSRLLAQLISLTRKGELHWERQLGSAHRYARWNNNLLILGPAAPLSEAKVPRYLFITPFDSPACIEINSANEELGSALVDLVGIVEQMSQHEPPTDPFGISEEELNRITS